MDPRSRADDVLDSAQLRGKSQGHEVVTPNNMVSPMDSAMTQQIPRLDMTTLNNGTTAYSVTEELALDTISGTLNADIAPAQAVVPQPDHRQPPLNLGRAGQAPEQQRFSGNI